MPIDESAYRRIVKQLDGAKVVLVAVSKTKSTEEIRSLYDIGQRDFGENYVQELVDKQSKLPTDIRWHYIGHLQTNKVKYIVPFIYLIHSVDSLKIHLYENLVKEGPSGRGGYTRHRTDYYIRFGDESHAIPVRSSRFLPRFEEKMSRALRDCPELAAKIQKKERAVSVFLSFL